MDANVLRRFVDNIIFAMNLSEECTRTYQRRNDEILSS